MEENKVDIPATQETKTETPSVEQPTVKTLTQEQVDVIVRDRLAKQKEQIYKNIGFENTDALKKKLGEYEAVLNEHELTKKELEAFKTEKAKKELTQKVTDMGVDPDFVDFVLGKVENNESFEENVKTFLEANPKIKADTYIRQSSNPSLNGGKAAVDLTKLTTKEFLEYRKNNPLK